MTGNHPSFPMDNRSLTLTLFLIFLSLLSPFISSAIHSPTPTPAPFPAHFPPKHIISEPDGLKAHAPPISLRDQSLSPPPPHSRRRHRPQPPPPPPPPGKLNLGKKVGLLFAAIATFLQVAFAAFLIYKRWQLKRMGRRWKLWFIWIIGQLPH